ncbi:hypothetical protein BKA56DRAFT_666982 [Ilyonectria sp. MPI-CAGE-AT-0026]|nr:hypothetical protein BKA56DRAFT_666982 [Ilyonectria sp. MPI-CAGE-AT-0026]
MASNSLTAAYASPTSDPFTISTSLPALQSPPSVADKTSYLAALQDKARDAASKNGLVDDAKEEENYGEEVQEDED